MPWHHTDVVEQGARPDGRRRRLFVVGAVVASAVAVVFGTVGDGVPASGDDGPRGLVVDHGHTLTWVLLALALGLAAVRGRWTAPSQVLAVAAGVVYGAFLLAVFVLR